ncbi:polysaccharide deacetylase family protein [Lentimicrobium sp. S6]|uniref:polysaccharide deacetylase family protein n=1 Tax=Lentimicrobium sp. S6 TaxID=2735872 RepID=UPI0015579017|nr:polysaccharide deacetylase family protein [Lentimicrobium sp. S6]NPD47274.1 polysaccharide deacetylase family protein [Lentimicrobium sp. S6]
MKNKTIILYLAFSFLSLISLAQENISFKQIAITIDDLPTLSHGLLSENEQTEYFNRVLRILEKHNISALGFVVGKLVNVNNSELIHNFISKGHIIGNHTYYHFDLNKTDANKYIDDIAKCENKISTYDVNKRYFRYPMLHRGDEILKKDSVILYLKNNAYSIVPVSIDTDEVSYNLDYVKAYANNDTLQMLIIGNDYINHMIEKTNYYNKLAETVNGKPIKHILLIHMNFINSIYLDELLNWYSSNNWRFIKISEALSDPFYQKEDKYLGKKGLSYIERINSPTIIK